MLINIFVIQSYLYYNDIYEFVKRNRITRGDLCGQKQILGIQSTFGHAAGQTARGMSHLFLLAEEEGIVSKPIV
jgi:hypothetical protein